jgi:hypothetical protein
VVWKGKELRQGAGIFYCLGTGLTLVCDKFALAGWAKATDNLIFRGEKEARWKEPTREHGMCRIADKDQTAAGPGWDGVAVEERPALDGCCFSTALLAGPVVVVVYI